MPRLGLGLGLGSLIGRPSVGGGSVVPFSPTDLPNLWNWFSSDFGTFYDGVGLFPTEPNGINFANRVQYWENKAEIPDNEAAVKLKVGSENPLILYRNQTFREDLENTFGAVSDIIYQSFLVGGTGKVCFKPLTNGVWFIANVDTAGGVSFNTVIQSTGGDTTYPWQGTTWPSPPVLTVSKLNGYPAEQSTEDLRPTLVEQTINGTTYRNVFFQNGLFLSVHNNIALNSSLSIYVVGGFTTANSFGCIFGGTRKTTPPSPGVRNGLCITSGGKLALVKSSFVTSTLDDPAANGIIFGVINSNGTGTIGKQSESISVSEDLTGLGTLDQTNINSYIMGVLTSNTTNGNIYELLVYRDVHTVEQQNQVISYLNERYPFIN